MRLPAIGSRYFSILLSAWLELPLSGPPLLERCLLLPVAHRVPSSQCRGTPITAYLPVRYRKVCSQNALL
jgi:hypothetical protein